MLETVSEIFPEGGASAGVVGAQEQGNHEDEAEDAGDADQEAENEGESDGEFTVGNEVGERLGVREDKVS